MDNISSKFTYFDILSRLIPGMALLLSLLLSDSVRNKFASAPSAEQWLLYFALLIVFGFIAGTFLQTIGTILSTQFYPNVMWWNKLLTKTRKNAFGRCLLKFFGLFFYRDKTYQMHREIGNELRYEFNTRLSLKPGFVTHIGTLKSIKEGDENYDQKVKDYYARRNLYKQQHLPLACAVDTYLETTLDKDELSRQDELASVEALMRSTAAFTVIETAYIFVLAWHHSLSLAVLVLIIGVLCTRICTFGQGYTHNIKVERKYMRALMELRIPNPTR